jgi:hypothetical protein
MPTQRIAFKEWLPDQPSILDSVSEANNVIPLAIGYGPFKSAVNYSGAASEDLNNCFAAKLDNDVFIFAVWTTTATSQSDYQIIPDGGDITGVVGGEFGIVFLEKAIVRMSYIGTPLIFQFDTVSRNVGCIEGNSIAQYSGTAYFLSDDGFYATNGQTLTGIGSEKVDRYFFNNANIGDIDSISAAVDPERNLVIWNYGNVSGGRSLLIYNFETQKWCEADTDVDYLSTLATSGTTLDGLDSAYNVTAGAFVVGKSYTIRTVGSTSFTAIGAVANTVGVLFTATGAGSGTGVAIDMAASAAALKTVDSLTTTLDDRLYKGGKFLFGGVRDTRIITFTGTYATGSIITNDLEYGYNSVVTLIRPSVDNGSASVQVASRRMLDDAITYGSSVTASQEDRCSVRSAGRYHRVALTPTGVNWSSAIGMDIDYSEQGTR